jgi:integrase/recombinase XerD
MSIDPLIDQFADALWLSDGLARNTIESYRRDVTQLHDWLVAQKRGALLDVANTDLQEFLGHRVTVAKSSARSTARLTSALKRFFQ